jgi:hypothetical protein
MWDYAGGFSVVNRKDNVSAPDEITLKALGLTVPHTPHNPASAEVKP